MPGLLQVTSPLSNQSNSGSMPSLSSAMKPSSDTAATFMIVLPMVAFFHIFHRSPGAGEDRIGSPPEQEGDGALVDLAYQGIGIYVHISFSQPVRASSSG